MERKFGLLIVDVQVDFCPGGALGVREGDEVVDPVNRLIDRCRERRIPCFFSRDWHPDNHCSFKKNGGIWPVHCVQGSRGGQWHEALKINRAKDQIFSKGEDERREAYSAFDNRGLSRQLAEGGVKKIVMGGLATDYCVRATVLDALKEGYAVDVVKEAIRGVELVPGDCRRAREEMEAAGARFVNLKEALDLLG